VTLWLHLTAAGLEHVGRDSQSSRSLLPVNGSCTAV
jgi:hypothetical protein